MGQTHGAGEHGGQEDVVNGHGMHQVLGVRHLAWTLHLLVDPKVRAELEARLNHQALVPQIFINAKF